MTPTWFPVAIVRLPFILRRQPGHKKVYYVLKGTSHQCPSTIAPLDFNRFRCFTVNIIYIYIYSNSRFNHKRDTTNYGLKSLLVLCRMHNSEIRFIVIFYRSIERDMFNNDSTYIGIPIYILRVWFWDNRPSSSKILGRDAMFLACTVPVKPGNSPKLFHFFKIVYF